MKIKMKVIIKNPSAIYKNLSKALFLFSSKKAYLLEVL